MTAGKILDNFYIRVLLKGWGICCLIWSFMIVQFWWGNHDWEFLKSGVSLGDGLFEARYSHHFPTVFFLDGQILPVLSYILTMFFLALLAVLIAKYLKCPEDEFKYLFFVMILAGLPHTPILFYYVFYMLPLLFWGCFAVGLLFLSTEPYRIWKFICGICGFTALLGSYPPIMSLILTVFVGRQIQYYIQKKQNFKGIIFNGLFLLGQLLIAYTIYRGIFSYLSKIGALNAKMYNVAIRDVVDIFKQVVVEIIAPISFIPQMVRSSGILYTLFYGLLVGGGLGIIFYKTPNRFIAFLLVSGLFLASRLAFLLSASSYYAMFRVGWWGEVGLMMSFLVLLLQTKNRWVKNLVYLGGFLFGLCFIKTDFELQKVQFLGFHAERLFQKRVNERLFDYHGFSMDNKYYTLNLGYPDLHRHFCYDGCYGFNNALLDSTVLPADFGQVIFWEEEKQPVNLRYGYWGDTLWFVGRGNLSVMKLKDIEEKISNIRQWMYSGVKMYPNSSSIYMHDGFIIFNFDEILFNSSREKVLEQFREN